MKERVESYREGLKHANPVGSFVNDQVAALCVVHCGEDDEEARRGGRTARGLVRELCREIVRALAGT